MQRPLEKRRLSERTLLLGGFCSLSHHSPQVSWRSPLYPEPLPPSARVSKVSKGEESWTWAVQDCGFHKQSLRRRGFRCLWAKLLASKLGHPHHSQKICLRPLGYSCCTIWCEGAVSTPEAWAAVQVALGGYWLEKDLELETPVIFTGSGLVSWVWLWVFLFLITTLISGWVAQHQYQLASLLGHRGADWTDGSYSYITKREVHMTMHVATNGAVSSTTWK